MHLTYGVGVVGPEHGGGALGIFKPPRLHHLQSAITHGRLFASGLFSRSMAAGPLAFLSRQVYTTCNQQSIMDV